MNPVEDILHRLLAALDAKDSAGIAALLTDDAMLVDELTRGWLRGRENIRAALASTLQSVDSVTSTLRELHVRESGSHALATCVLEQTYALDGTEVAVVAPTSFSLEQRAGSWCIVLMHSVPIATA